MVNPPPFKKNLLSKAIAPTAAVPVHDALPGELTELKASSEDFQLASRIVARAVEDGRGRAFIDPTIALIDILATHTNGRPLRLLQWLMSHPADFEADFVLINRTINRRTGKLMLPESVRLTFQAEAH